MSNYKNRSHVIYRCYYHIVWTPKYRYKVLEGFVKHQLVEDLEMLLEWKQSEKKELNVQKSFLKLNPQAAKTALI